MSWYQISTILKKSFAAFEDYDNSSVMLTFRPGGATILPVPILGFEDDQVEGNEEYTATLELSDPPDGVSLGDDTARATIIDDDSKFTRHHTHLSPS